MLLYLNSEGMWHALDLGLTNLFYFGCSMNVLFCCYILGRYMQIKLGKDMIDGNESELLICNWYHI